MIEGVAYSAAWRDKLRKHSGRQGLRIRIPQAEETRVAVPEDEPEDESGSDSPDSDAESDDGDDSDEEDKGDTPKPSESASRPTTPVSTAPGFTTLVPDSSTIQPPATGGTTVDSVQTAASPGSIVNPVTEMTTFISSTILSEPLSQSSVPTDGAEESIVTTTTESPETAAPSNVPSGGADEISGSRSGSPNLSRGADVGIILGTLALASILIAAGIFFCSRRKRANNEHLGRLPFDKPLPNSLPDNSPDDSRGLKLNSWAMFVPPEESGGRGEQPMEYYMGEKAELPRSMGPGESPLPLTAPPTAYGAAGRQRSVEMGNPRMTYSNKEVMVQPIHQTAPRGVDNLDIYPPGQVPLGNFRVPSMAQTNTTESTEGTWRTWNVDQRQTSRGKKPWKERFLG